MDLLNWLWQSSLVALLVRLAVGLPRSINAATRYVIWWITLGVVLAMAAVPSSWRMFTDVGEPVARAVSSGAWLTLPPLPAWLGPMLLGVWTIWVSVWIARGVLAWFELRRLRGSIREVGSGVEERLPAWSALKGSGRIARLTTSAQVSSAAVLGLQSPAIVLSPWTTEQLAVEDLDRIVIHEWAHVQRRDDFAALAQLLIRAVAGFHPAVWWLDRAIAFEREIACDDWVIELTGSPRHYAACLARMAERRCAPPALALSVLPVRRAHLTRRIARLLDTGRNGSVRRSHFTLVLAGTGALTAALGAFAIDAVEVMTRPGGASLPAASAALVAPQAVRTSSAASPQAVPARKPAVRTAPGFKLISNVSSATTDRAGEPGSLESSGLPDPPRDRVVVEPSIAANPLVEHFGASAPRDLTSMPPSAGESARPERDIVMLSKVSVDLSKDIGRGSQKAAASTARFFSRLGRSVASLATSRGTS